MPGTAIEALQNSQKFRVGTLVLYPYPYPHPGIFKRAYPYPGYCAAVVHNSQKFRVRVRMSYRTYRSSGTGNTRENTLVWFCTYPTEHWKYGWSKLNIKIEMPSKLSEIADLTRISRYSTNKIDKTEYPKKKRKRMLNTRLRIQIPSKLSEIADPTLFSR